MNHPAIAELLRTLRSLGETGTRLTPATVTDEALEHISRNLNRARGLLETTRRPAPRTRCRQHPRGPVEPGTDGGCLLCTTRRRRAASDPVDRPPVELVLRTLTEAGEQEAVRHFGARAVARAHLTAARTANSRPSTVARPPTGPDNREDARA